MYQSFLEILLVCVMMNFSRLSLTPLLLMTAAVAAQADVKDRLYDFTDSYYLQNGVNPAAIAGRRTPGATFVTSPPVAFGQRDLRALFTIGGWQNGGQPIFYTVLGELSAASFTQDDAGRRAMRIADASPEYIFPKRGTDPTGLGAPRQNFMLDISNGYFSNNRLGLWIHTFVNFTDAAFNTSRGQRLLQDLGRKNGLALDGTPIIKTTSDLDNLFSKGMITKTTLPAATSGRYAICPAVKDPTDGGIAADQFLFTVRDANGNPTDPKIARAFDSLRLNGRWP
jgi:hypothetical protein